jgi:hypothetical protein
VTDFAESDALHARARELVRAFEDGRPPPEPFDALARDIARFQAAHVEGYARLCAARGVRPDCIDRAADAPAVPTDAFKLARVAAFPPDAAGAVFRTSGTTIGARGTHEMRSSATYDLGALAFARRMLTPDWKTPFPVLALAPSPNELPDSSLVHMIAAFARSWGPPDERVFFIEGDVIDVMSLDEIVAREMTDGTDRLLLCGTSFAFVHFLEGFEDDTMFRLPAGSRVMQTGGFKGKSREVEPEKLRSDIARAFGLAPHAVIGEYGMTELSSQFYESSPGVYAEPPWARVVPVDPETLAPVADGEIGIARIEDLLNVDSAFAVLAADRVRRVPGGFELLGRAPGAAPRGCSIAVDEILGR